MSDDQIYKINVSVKFKSTKGVRRFVIRADNFQGLHDAFWVEMKKVAPNATAIYWTDADGDKVYMEGVAELEEAYHLSAAPNNNLLNLTIDEEIKKDPETRSTSSSSSSQDSGSQAGPTMPPQNMTGALHNAICDLCDCPIVGHRFRCLMCNDFDLCGPCESTGAHSEHAMLRIVDPDVTRIPWGAKLSHDCQRLYQGLDEQLRQSAQPSQKKQFTNIKNQGINMLMEVGNVLQTTLANFGIEASYEVRNPSDHKERKAEKPAETEAPAAPVVETSPAPEIVPNAPPQEEAKEKKIRVVRKATAPKAETNTVLKKSTEAKEVAFVAAPVVKKVKPAEQTYESIMKGLNEAGAYVAAHGPALPTQMSTHEKSRRAKIMADLIQYTESKPTTQNENSEKKKPQPKIATGIFATANRRVPPPFPSRPAPPAPDMANKSLIPGLFAQKKVDSPRFVREREFERRRDNYHSRPERCGYHSDESVGRSPSPPPPRFAGVRGSNTRSSDNFVQYGTRFEDYDKAKAAKADIEAQNKFKAEARKNPTENFGSAPTRPERTGPGFYPPSFGSSSFDKTTSTDANKASAFGKDKPIGFGGNSGAFGGNYGGFGGGSGSFGCRSGFGADRGFGGFGNTSGFGSGTGFSERGSFGYAGRGFGFSGRNYENDFPLESEFGKNPFPSRETNEQSKTTSSVFDKPQGKYSKFNSGFTTFYPADDWSDDDDDFNQEEVKPLVSSKKSAFKNVSETAKKPESKAVRRISATEAIAIISAKKAAAKGEREAAATVCATTENVATSVFLTNCSVDLEKKEDTNVADVTVGQENVFEMNNATLSVIETEVNVPAMAVVPYVEKEDETTETTAVPETTPEATANAPETVDTQSIGSEVEQIEDVDSDGWVDAKEVSDAMVANVSAILDGSVTASTSATVPTPRENVYPSLMQEEVSAGGQAREDTFAALLTMGFSDIQARRAIAHCGSDLCFCVEYITMQQ